MLKTKFYTLNLITMLNKILQLEFNNDVKQISIFLNLIIVFKNKILQLEFNNDVKQNSEKQNSTP